MFILYCMFSPVAPETVTISGKEHAKAGETIKLTCVSDISNPRAVITWFSRGQQLRGATEKVEVSPRVSYHHWYLTEPYSMGTETNT